MIDRYSTAKIVLALLLLISSSACVRTMTVSPHKTVLPESSKKPITVALVLGKEFANYHFAHKTVPVFGDTLDYPFGPVLQEYALNVASNRFSAVITHDAVAPATDVADAILVPRVYKVDESLGRFAFSKHHITISIEWTIRSSDAQRVIWLSTIEASAEGNMGNLFTGSANQKRLLQALFDDLTTKTVTAFASAREINELKSRPR
jgi:hypothetical protein